MKYTVLWTGAEEIYADSHQAAIDIAKASPTWVFEHSNFGASDGIVSYSEPRRQETEKEK